MKLPNLENAIVPVGKITDYLLSETHEDGKHKAAFVGSFGFELDEWRVMANALRQHAADHEVAKVEGSPFGTRYVIEGIIRAPDGRTPDIRTVWFVENDEEVPRFVTAYPLRRREDD